MSFIHKLGLFLAGFTFRTVLFFGLTIFALVMVLGNRDTFKNALLQADSYNRFSQSVIDSGKSQGVNDPNAIPLADPQIQSIIKQSLDSRTLQSISESAIDSTYDWLEGDTKTIEFNADLSKNKDFLATGISNYAVERLVNLPVCTETPKETNVFLISCYPFNTDINLIKTQIYNTLIEDESIFKSTNITTNDFPKTAEGIPLTEAYASAPKYYMWFKILPYILFIIALFALVAIVFLDRSRKKGIHMVATSIIGTGIILMIAPIIYTYVLPSVGIGLPGTGSGENESLNAISNDTMKYIYREFNTTLINMAIQLTVIGVAILVGSKIILRKKSPYEGLRAKTGLSLSIDANPHKSNVKISAKDVPVQSSEKPGKTKRRITPLEKRFRQL